MLPSGFEQTGGIVPWNRKDFAGVGVGGQGEECRSAEGRDGFQGAVGLAAVVTSFDNFLLPFSPTRLPFPLPRKKVE